MLRRLSMGLMALAVVGPVGASAQMGGHAEGMKSFHAEQVNDVRTIGEKFVALAEAFSQEQYDWRPMAEVRSVGDVMALMVSEFYVFPTVWGVDTPEGIPGDFGGAMGRFSAMSKTEIVAEMGKAAAHAAASVEGLSENDRMMMTTWFGTEVTRAVALSKALGDMHEHLGQAIAYARTNHIVPPWSN